MNKQLQLSKFFVTCSLQDRNILHGCRGAHPGTVVHDVCTPVGSGLDFVCWCCLAVHGGQAMDMNAGNVLCVQKICRVIALTFNGLLLTFACESASIRG